MLMCFIYSSELDKTKQSIEKALLPLKNFLGLLILLVDCHCHSGVAMAGRLSLDKYICCKNNDLDSEVVVHSALLASNN